MKRRRRDEYDEPEPEERSTGGSFKWLIVIGTLTLLVLVGAVVLFLVFSGESNQAVFDRYREKFAAKRQQFQAIAAKLPAIGSVRKNQGPGNLNPRPIYDPRSKTFNTSVVMAEQLRDPDVRLQTPEQFDLNLFEGLLLMNMQWTGPAESDGRIRAWAKSPRQSCRRTRGDVGTALPRGAAAGAL